MDAPPTSQAQKADSALGPLDSPLLDSKIKVSNPGSYEELHKKTKG